MNPPFLPSTPSFSCVFPQTRLVRQLSLLFALISLLQVTTCSPLPSEQGNIRYEEANRGEDTGAMTGSRQGWQELLKGRLQGADQQQDEKELQMLALQSRNPYSALIRTHGKPEKVIQLSPEEEQLIVQSMMGRPVRKEKRGYPDNNSGFFHTRYARNQGFGGLSVTNNLDVLRNKLLNEIRIRETLMAEQAALKLGNIG